MEKVAEKTDKKISKYLGYKFFKNKEGSDTDVNLVRITGISDYNNEITITDLDTNKSSKVKFEDLKSYTPLEPVGFVSFSKVGMKDKNGRMNKDIIVSLYRMLDIKLNINEPYAICRQSINDFFYAIIAPNPDHELAGVCCSRENCPEGMPYYAMAACDEVEDFTIVNFYLDDTILNLLDFINKDKYDKVLNALYVDHMRSLNPAYSVKGDQRKSHDGWCRNLEMLLTENNVQTDMDAMRNITSVDFDVEEYLDKKVEKDDIEVNYLKPELLKFISNTFRINIKPNAMALKFDVDIDLGDFNNINYVLIRDNKNNTYVISYVLDGEFREAELIDEENTLSGIDKLRIQFYNKYHDQK